MKPATQVDLYGALGLPKECTAAELKKTYRKLALQLHPDKNPGNKPAEAQFQEVRQPSGEGCTLGCCVALTLGGEQRLASSCAARSAARHTPTQQLAAGAPHLRVLLPVVPASLKGSQRARMGGGMGCR